MSTYNVVKIEWVDACSQSAWLPISQHQEQPLAHIFTVGILLHKDKKVTRVCLSLHPSDGVASDSLGIPTASIIRMETIKSYRMED